MNLEGIILPQIKIMVHFTAFCPCPCPCLCPCPSLLPPLCLLPPTFPVYLSLILAPSLMHTLAAHHGWCGLKALNHTRRKRAWGDTS